MFSHYGLNLPSVWMSGGAFALFYVLPGRPSVYTALPGTVIACVVSGALGSPRFVLARPLSGIRCRFASLAARFMDGLSEMAHAAVSFR